MKQISTDLTRAELEVMQIIWEKEPLFLNEIYDCFPESENRPAYTTISSFIRILERKGYISHKTYGKSHRYFTLVSKEEYTHRFMQKVMSNFFNNSPSQLLSFFAENGNLTASQYEELKVVAEKILKQ